jgi:hypothetical protein
MVKLGIAIESIPFPVEPPRGLVGPEADTGACRLTLVA